jgi:hypothetical protein
MRRWQEDAMLHRLLALGFSTLTYAACVLAVTGCTSENPAQVTGDDPQAVTYYQDVAPILAQRCTSCHTPGGLGPFSLETYADAQSHAAEVAAAVSAGTMPPLPPATTGCQPLDDDRVMATAERDTLINWKNAGAPEGDPANAAPALKPVDLMGPPTLNIDSGLDYNSDFTGSDEYRCFVIDPKITGQFPLIAADTTNTNRAIVHHVIVYAALPQNLAAVQALDAADPKPGYECFGGAGFTGAIPVSASAVGSRTRPFPDSSGVPLPAGTQFVVQVHYNFDNARGSNRLALQLWKSQTPLTQVPHGMNLVNYTFFLPAGAPDVEATAMGRFADTGANGNDVTKPGKLWSVFPHMHQLGKSAYVELIRNDGTHECLLNIPGTWDFHWQGSYQFVNPVQVNAGDQVKVTCTWDNSAANQPIVNGVKRDPQNVTWGEGSTDEMCIAGLLLTD